MSHAYLNPKLKVKCSKCGKLDRCARKRLCESCYQLTPARQAVRRAYRQINRDRIRERNQKYRQTHRKSVNANAKKYQAERRARKKWKQAIPKLSTEDEIAFAGM